MKGRVEGTEDPPHEELKTEHRTARHLRVAASQLPLQFKKIHKLHEADRVTSNSETRSSS